MSLFSKATKPRRIFLDFASTTPMLPEAKKEMEKYFSDKFYNSSAIYKEGTANRDDLLEYRKKVARILHASHKDIVFTSGGTESNNQAILGIFESMKDQVKKPHIVISSIEHSAIKEASKEIETRGGEVSIIDVDENGIIKIEELKKSIKENTILVSVMLANNEIGTIEPIPRIARVIKEFRKMKNTNFPFFHTDASQAANYLSLDISSLGVDLLTLDGSKIYGPKGIGILVVKSEVKIRPIIFGGGQEGGLRSGTENLPSVSGFTKALEIVQNEKESETNRLNELKNFFIENIQKEFPNLIINTSLTDSLPNIVSVSFPGSLGEFLALKLDQEGIMVSTGSSCGIYKDVGGSSTVKGIGKEDLSESTIRFSFGRTTTKKELNKTLQILKKILFS